jgi:hypothetical protein
MNVVRRSSAQIWRWPVVLAVLTVSGLFSALPGQSGVWLPLSWLLLAVPLLVIARCLQARQRFTRG